MFTTEPSPLPAGNVISIGELNRRARQLLEGNFPLLWVSGEISNLTRAASGHVYFSLKDSLAQVRCVMFRSRAQVLPWRLENGQQVEAQVLVSLYEARGDFQLNVEGMRRAGLGRLFETFARLKQQLESEGLFAAERKRPLPSHPRSIGIVSSPQAAALRDILISLQRRAPHLPVILYPTLVQGEHAAKGIATAIATANARAECDVLIVARGGGSIEDLWAFNEEACARAIVASTIPIVSGVGHETDFTIADFAADLRAPTPTAAAELATSGWFAARHALQVSASGLQSALRRQLHNRMQQVDVLSHRLLSPQQRMAQNRQHLQLLKSHLQTALQTGLRQRQHLVSQLTLRLQRRKPDLAAQRTKVQHSKQRLESTLHDALVRRQQHFLRYQTALKHLNPNSTLARGYSIVRDATGQIIRDSRQLSSGAAIRLHFGQGAASARVEQIDPE